MWFFGVVLTFLGVGVNFGAFQIQNIGFVLGPFPGPISGHFSGHIRTCIYRGTCGNGFGRGATAQRVQAGRPGHGSARRRASVVPARTLRVWCSGSGTVAAQLVGTTFGLFDADPEC